MNKNFPEDSNMGCSVDWEKFKLQHYDSDLFHRSEWDGRGKISHWYTVYRIVLAVFMLTGVVLHFSSTQDTLGSKWFIYMTNQGIGLLTLHYLIYAGIVLGRRLGKQQVPAVGLSPLYSISWGMQTCFSTVALWISIIYWTALHKYVMEFGIIQGAWMHLLNVFLHAVNTISCLVDMMVTARPVRIHHFYLAVIFGIWYTLFSLVYWAAGGTGVCMPRCDLDPSCAVVCDKYIYPILDWEDHPGLAVGIVLGGCIFMPLLQAAWWGVVWARRKLHSKKSEEIYEVKDPEQDDSQARNSLI